MFCGCGRAAIVARGRCARCYMEYWRFGGHRPAVVARDEGLCQGCADRAAIVHHRRRINEPRYMLALCRRCHARIHHTYRPKFGEFTPRLRQLWREQHPDLAEQVELALLGPAEFTPDQIPLFPLVAAAAA